MADESYTLEDAESDIGTLRGQVDRMNEIVRISDSSNTPNTPTSGFSLFSLLGVAQFIGSSGLTGAVPQTQSDISSNTVTQATTNQLSGEFTVQAKDANVGTCYRIKCGGFGTWASSGPQQLTLIQILGGTNINQINIAAGAFATSTAFDWELEMSYFVVTTGAGGTCRALLRPILNINSAAVNTGTNSNAATGVRQAGGVTFNTTVSRTMRVNALWAATTGSPTITCDRTTFERIGA